MKRRDMNKMMKKLLTFLAVLMIALAGGSVEELFDSRGQDTVSQAADLASVPAYTGHPYTVINDNEPYFSEEDMTTESFESYGALDSLGRCTVVFANIGRDLMPRQERGDIYMVHPSGWQSARYSWIDGESLYNRCHLIGYQLTAENANERNLLTGTRYMNTEGMLPFENEVAEYIHKTGNHVLYRVTPVFEGRNLVASGVQMEAKSVEDDGRGISYNVFCYNVQPGIEIDYATGDNWEAETAYVR